MRKYITNPIEAVQLTVNNELKVCERLNCLHSLTFDGLHLNTRNGWKHVKYGEYIIITKNGNIKIMSKENFERIYIAYE